MDAQSNKKKGAKRNATYLGSGSRVPAVSGESTVVPHLYKQTDKAKVELQKEFGRCLRLFPKSNY